MKKLFSLFLVLTLVFSLTACGKKEQTNNTDQGQTPTEEGA